MKSVENSASSVVTIPDKLIVEGRAFPYVLNKKKAKAKLLQGAKRSKNLDIEVKSGCVNFRFNNGSYYEVLLPLVKGQTVQLNNTEVEIVNVQCGTEVSDLHVDTKITMHIHHEKIIMHAYNSTQNLMVQEKQ